MAAKQTSKAADPGSGTAADAAYALTPKLAFQSLKLPAPGSRCQTRKSSVHVAVDVKVAGNDAEFDDVSTIIGIRRPDVVPSIAERHVHYIPA